MTQTLPERLVLSIKMLVTAHRDYSAVVEALQALDASMQGNLDQLFTRQEKLADISLVGKGPVKLPDAILPQTHRIVPRETEGAA